MGVCSVERLQKRFATGCIMVKKRCVLCRAFLLASGFNKVKEDNNAYSLSDDKKDFHTLEGKRSSD